MPCSRTTGRRGLVGRLGRELGLDVEPHLGVARAARELEHLGERRNAHAVLAPLVGEAPRVVGAGPDAPDVEAL